MTPDEQVADALSVPDAVVEPTTPAEVIALLTAQKARTDPERATLCKALEDMAAFLRRHPTLPLPTRPDVTAFLAEDDFAGVDALADVMGVQPGWLWSEGGSREAHLDFGGGVAYRVVSHSSASMAATAAVSSYHGSVTP